MAKHHVAVIEGDDASPEAVGPVVQLVSALVPDIEWHYPPVGEPARTEFGTPFPDESRQMIDDCETTLFGATSSSSAIALFYLRWGKQTYANVRPTKYLRGYRSSLAKPEGVDLLIVRENLEDLYLGIEGDVEELASLGLASRTARRPLADFEGRYALKVITRQGSARVVRKAFELARQRRARNGRGKVTIATKHNMLPRSDGVFREVGLEIAKEFPDIECESLIVDDFAHRLCHEPQRFDVTVMPNLYGDILSDAAAGLVGGLGMAASGCYGDDYAYFESAHGTAPDIAGRNIINPTATLLSACMMLDYLGYTDVAGRIESAVERVYARGDTLTPDQGGAATTTEFCEAIAALAKEHSFTHG